jgi:hypothetical protein
MTGLVNLLRRGIPRTEILNRIFEEWRKTRQRSTLKRALWPAIETLIREENARPPRQRQPVATYRAISALWQRRH